jgi:hypothetical protein
MADKLNLAEESPRAVKPAYEFGLPVSVYPATDFSRPNIRKDVLCTISQP